MDPHSVHRRAAYAAPVIYCLISLVLIAQHPGPQYDEVLPAMAAVHIARASGPPSYPHDPDTWICAGSQCLPLMNLRYVGAVKDLLYLPVWAVTGPSAAGFRALSMLMGAAGVLGVAVLLARFADWRAAAIGATVLAIHPAYLLQTVFDSGLIATWMLSVGLICLALSGYAAAPGPRTAFLLGAACGFAIWARANFLWLLLAAGAAVAALAWSELARHKRNLPFLFLGGVFGGLPFLVYQWISRGGTLEALAMYPAEGTLASQLPSRLTLLAETLLADREHRAMWGGAAMPLWQVIPIVALAGIALVACARTGIFGRVVSLATVLLAAILLTSRMAIGEHHLVAVVPLLAIAAGVAATRGRFATPMILLYACLAFWWHAAAILGLRDTGGTGHWSDSSATLAETLERSASEAVFIDWGLRNQVYFLSRGAVPCREIFGDETRAETGETWIELVQPGRAFVTNGPAHRGFRAPTEGLRNALATRPTARRIAVPQRNGNIYAEILFDASR